MGQGPILSRTAVQYIGCELPYAEHLNPGSHALIASSRNPVQLCDT